MPDNTSTPTPRAPTLYDFQLSMLHAMCKSAPAQAANLLDRVGATRADAAVAEKRWWFADATNDFRSIAEYVTAWGAPASERSEHHGDREARYAVWDLPFWPGLQIEWMEIPPHPRLFRQLLRTSHSLPPAAAEMGCRVSKLVRG
ncbi:hypothetical protein [Nocardia sp. CA-119907]|uniref:hypothetical protein n=1 Tax=Nocardia sp. CA-119907 TaxID=3239973 RepID=UPI003D962968